APARHLARCDAYKIRNRPLTHGIVRVDELQANEMLRRIARRGLRAVDDARRQHEDGVALTFNAEAKSLNIAHARLHRPRTRKPSRLTVTSPTRAAPRYITG